MKILITGGSGNLATELAKVLGKDYDLYAPAHSDLDITSPQEINRVFSRLNPDFVINAAAITDVDSCENQFTQALAVNGWGPFHLARACQQYQSIFVHFSTEMIFDGLKTTPYLETDRPNPILAYGLTKHIGEQNIQCVQCHYTIFRTSWLFGGSAPKFVNRFIEIAKQQPSVPVVYDQIGSPTYIRDIAVAINQYLQEPHPGIYHLVDSGQASRLDMARLIKKELSLDCELLPVSYEDLKIATYRPPHAVLDSLYKDKYSFLRLRPWEEAMREYLRGLKTDTPLS
ncbi:MAG: hypothetical protein APF84_08630 [Gracilibacter sp. BRH_c7a]|nr:MAG: hypothetical protein APF84_08630 [Gracilibacter sp. BRH_c7a]